MDQASPGGGRLAARRWPRSFSRTNYEVPAEIFLKFKPFRTEIDSLRAASLDYLWVALPSGIEPLSPP